MHLANIALVLEGGGMRGMGGLLAYLYLFLCFLRSCSTR